MKYWLLYALKIGVAAALLWLVFRFVPMEQVQDILKNINMKWVLLALLLMLLGQVGMAWRMQFLFGQAGVKIAHLHANKLIFMSNFCNNWLPGGLGGDVVRGYLFRAELPAKKLVQLLVAERLSGLSVIAGMALIFLMLLLPADAKILALILAVGAAFYHVFSKRLLGLSSYAAWGCVFLSWGNYVVWTAAFVALLYGLLPALTWHGLQAYLVLYSLAVIAAILPISVGGLGLREFVFAYGAPQLAAMTHVSLDSQILTAAGLALYGVMLLASAPGGWWLLQWRELAPGKD